MQHCTKTFDFDVECFGELKFDFDLAKDPSKINDLIRFTRTYHNREALGELTSEGKVKEESWAVTMTMLNRYQNMVTEAVKANNIEGLEVLWQATYLSGPGGYHDRGEPDYSRDLYTAFRFSNLEMVQHCLWTFLNTDKHSSETKIDLEFLEEDSSYNPHPEVKKYYEKISEWFGNSEYFGSPMREKDYPGFYEFINA